MGNTPPGINSPEMAAPDDGVHLARGDTTPFPIRKLSLITAVFRGQYTGISTVLSL